MSAVWERKKLDVSCFGIYKPIPLGCYFCFGVKMQPCKIDFLTITPQDQSRTFKDKVFDGDKTKVELRALDNCRTAIDLHEICERLSIRNHTSFLFHDAIYKVTRDILTVANPWMFGTSSLELQNADTKRTARLSGSKRLELSDSGQTRVGLNPGFEGPLRITSTKGHGTTLALSTLKFLAVRGYLRRGDGLVATPMSRRKERLFGENGTGRLSSAATGLKFEVLASDYVPREDT